MKPSEGRHHEQLGQKAIKTKKANKTEVLKAFKMVAGEGHDPPTCGL